MTPGRYVEDALRQFGNIMHVGINKNKGREIVTESFMGRGVYGTKCSFLKFPINMNTNFHE